MMPGSNSGKRFAPTYKHYKMRSLTCTGHSLGGILALKASTELMDVVTCSVYCYGIPKLRKRWLAGKRLPADIVIYRNLWDPVTWLPYGKEWGWPQATIKTCRRPALVKPPFLLAQHSIDYYVDSIDQDRFH
jgi:hypothetical protein